MLELCYGHFITFTGKKLQLQLQLQLYLLKNSGSNTLCIL